MNPINPINPMNPKPYKILGNMDFKEGPQPTKVKTGAPCRFITQAWG